LNNENNENICKYKEISDYLDRIYCLQDSYFFNATKLEESFIMFKDGRVMGKSGVSYPCGTGIALNSLVSNMLSSAITLIEEQRKFAKKHGIADFEKHCAMMYDGSTFYQLAYYVRNETQHGHLLVRPFSDSANPTAVAAISINELCSLEFAKGNRFVKSLTELTGMSDQELLSGQKYAQFPLGRFISEFSEAVAIGNQAFFMNTHNFLVNNVYKKSESTDIVPKSIFLKFADRGNRAKKIVDSLMQKYGYENGENKPQPPHSNKSFGVE